MGEEGIKAEGGEDEVVVGMIDEAKCKVGQGA
jgi:hypothetical protein